MQMMTFKTDFQRAKEQRDRAMYNEYKELTSNPKNSKMQVYKYLMNKHGIHSTSYLIQIIKKIENVK